MSKRCGFPWIMYLLSAVQNFEEDFEKKAGILWNTIGKGNGLKRIRTTENPSPQPHPNEWRNKKITTLQLLSHALKSLWLRDGGPAADTCLTLQMDIWNGPFYMISICCQWFFNIYFKLCLVVSSSIALWRSLNTERGGICNELLAVGCLFVTLVLLFEKQKLSMLRIHRTGKSVTANA